MLSPINSANYTPAFKSMDTKDKIILSTPLLAAASKMHEYKDARTSTMLLKGGNAFGKWVGGLAAVGIAISANKVLARNSKRVRDFEENHAVWSMIGLGAAATGIAYVIHDAAKGIQSNKREFFDDVTRFVRKIDDVGFINDTKSWFKNRGRDYRRMINHQPQFIQSANRGISKLGNATIKYLPQLAIATACALAIVRPKMMPKDY